MAGSRGSAPGLSFSGAFAIVLPLAWPHLRRDLPVLRRHWGITLVLVPFYGAELAAGQRIVPGVPAFAAMAYVAVFPSFLAYLAYNRGVELIGAGLVLVQRPGV